MTCQYCKHAHKDHKNSSGTLYCVGGGCMPCSCDSFVATAKKTKQEEILERIEDIEKKIGKCDEICAKLEATLDKILEELRSF